MKKIAFAVFGGLILLSAAGPSLASGRSSDMFDNATWASANRPSTRSDRLRTRDMFPDLPPISSRADMFQSAVQQVAVREDMLALRSVAQPTSRLFARWADR